MTFTNQEVPSWEIYESNMYDLTLPEILAGEATSYVDQIKVEDTYSPYMQQRPATPISNQQIIGSPSMNMPVLCQYNPYSPIQAPSIQSLASPSNAFVNSPAPSNYSASPVNSPQQPYPSEDFLHYGYRQAMLSRHNMYSQAIPQSGYYYGDYSGKRRKRDDELSPQEYEKRRLRRERNKQAALRCRTRRRERIDALEQETNEIEEDNRKVENEISQLRKQMDDLSNILQQHQCEKQINLNDTSPLDFEHENVKPEPH